MLTTDIHVYREVLNYLISKLLEGYDRATSTDGPFEEPRLGGYFDTIIRRIYTESVERIEGELREALKNLMRITQRHQQRVVYDVKWFLLRLVERGGVKGMEKRLGKRPKAPNLYLYMEDRLARLWQEVLKLLAKRRTFTYAMYVTILLDRMPREDERVEIEALKGPLRIHRVWSFLAERGVGLLCEPGFCGRVDEVVEVFESSCKHLVEKDGNRVIGDLEYHIKRDQGDQRRSSLSGIISSYIKPYVRTQELFGSLVDYFVNHLEALGSLSELSARGVEDYIRKVFCDRAFLEYEVYSRFVNNGIPALPRLQVSSRNMRPREVDILAASRGRLYVVEVTARSNQENLRRKLDTLSELSKVLNAYGNVLISTKEICEDPNLLTDLDSAKCVSFEDLCAGAWRLIGELFGSP